MAENLAYLPSVVGPATESYTAPYYYVYGYDGTNVTDAKAYEYTPSDEYEYSPGGAPIKSYETYGVLYNWSAAMNGAATSNTIPSGVQGACPEGWHLPSDAEWTILADFLGGQSIAGGKVKEAGTAHWTSPNEGATNSSGFTALPAGYRYSYKKSAFNGVFAFIGFVGHWWSSTEGDTDSAWDLTLLYESSYFYMSYGNDCNVEGYSVRCLRD